MTSRGRTGNGNPGTVETRRAHCDIDAAATLKHLAADRAALGRHRECGIGDLVRVPQIARKDPQTIAALFRFRSIRIEDPQRESRFGLRTCDQNPVGPDAEMPVTDRLHQGRRECLGLTQFQNQVVVSESLVFVKLHGRVAI